MTSRSFFSSRPSYLRLLSHVRSLWVIRALLFTAVLALLVACLFDETGPNKKRQLSKDNWNFNEITYDLGEIVGGDTVYGLGKRMVVGGDEMLASVDTITTQPDPSGLFSNQRECFYNVKWKHPGACVEDDSWIFSADGSFAVQDGEEACPERSELPEGIWSINEKETEISLTVSDKTRLFAVEELTSDNLRLSQTRTDTTACGETVLVKTSFSFSAL